ncbi:unnamed protein product [Eruca vesicaria subsp. sativa]|uniref:Uncharacterized protein n=1 Tax=Eruca vesicaria subsp. sativa TaxID=29727 RepID=A0ABC8JHG3_ERUVS|nr:unnamed protein product [Eruca vesicaria subsp. sativa]
MKIEKEWEEEEKVRKRSKVMEVEDKNNEGTGNYINEVKDTFPFGCFLCRLPFVDSVVITYAKHYLPKRVLCSTFHHFEIHFEVQGRITEEDV